MKKQKQQHIIASTLFMNAVFLTFAGGYLDAYTYAQRDGVFANAQTGNIVKLGIHLAMGHYDSIVRFVIPIIAFVLGTVTVLIIESVFEKKQIHFIRRGTILIEMLILLLVYFIPQQTSLNIIANALISFAAAMQMECFRTFCGLPMTTTVATGNLRKMVEFIYSGIRDKDSEKFVTAARFFFILLVFVSGAYTGPRVAELIGNASILLLLIPYTISFIFITIMRKY